MAGRTHRTRLARDFAVAQSLSYQKALAHVIVCSEAGLLPARLDHEGMEQALVVLQQNLGAPGLTRQARSGAEPKTAAGDENGVGEGSHGQAAGTVQGPALCCPGRGVEAGT